MTSGLFKGDDAFEAFQTTRAAAFTALIEELVPAIADPAKADFARALGHAKVVLGKDELHFSRLFKVSRPTVNRWLRGVTSPHPLLQKAVYETLLTETKQALRKFGQPTSAAH
jgi:hypothetical protein